jgi:VIT1/CCC1 family predicted Fe2+/Mn2+ transporter
MELLPLPDPKLNVPVACEKLLHIRAAEPELPSAKLAAVSSFIAFAAGATVPLIPYMFGLTEIVYSMVISLFGLFGAGVLVSFVTTRTWWYSGTRQLLIGSGAAALTWFLGTTIGAAL